MVTTKKVLATTELSLEIVLKSANEARFFHQNSSKKY